MHQVEDLSSRRNVESSRELGTALTDAPEAGEVRGAAAEPEEARSPPPKSEE
jgi:hypothetical protein